MKKTKVAVEDGMRIENLSVESLVPYARNAKLHDDAQIADIAGSIREFGFNNPVLIDKGGGIIAGHGRVLAARKLGMDSVPCIRLGHLTENQKRAYILADNRLAEKGGGWDNELLKVELEGIDFSAFEDFSMDDLGFDMAEIDAILAQSDTQNSEADAEPQIDKAAELAEKWGVKRNQLWQLGNHRILCGDSTNKEDVEKVMQGEKAELVVTDPPYGVSYADKNRFLNTIGKANRIEKPIENDHLTKDETKEMWRMAFKNMNEAMAPGACVYCFMPQGGDQMMMMMMMEGAGIEPRHELIWVKNNHVLGRVDYAYKHDPIMYAWKEGGHKFYGDFQTSIIECDRPNKSGLHPTTKPVELIQRLVENSSLKSGIVYEPFSGSGTTIIACEQLGRKCRAIEISPAYVAVAIQRWADATGGEPRLLG